LNCLGARRARERERECLAEGANEQGKWASGAHALKGRGRAVVVGKRADVDASMAEAWAGGYGWADRWGP
jgi:hypothetical protein